jgi:hypothetical protein
VVNQGDCAFVTDPYNGGGSGLYAVNINPASGLCLQKYGPCNTNAPGVALPRGVAAHGDYAYTVDWNKGLVVIDISDPADPAEGPKIISLY